MHQIANTHQDNQYREFSEYFIFSSKSVLIPSYTHRISYCLGTDYANVLRDNFERQGDYNLIKIYINS